MENYLTQQLRQFAAAVQIDLLGITTAEPVVCLPWDYDDDPAHYQPCRPTRIADNTYAPQMVLENARSVIIVGMYMYGFDRLEHSVPGCPRGNIGPWTRGYVEAGRYAADTVVDWLTEKGYTALFTNALPYRTLALRCGLGSIGNNGFLYRDGMGSYIRLGCVVTNAILTPYTGAVVHGNDCGPCRLCSKVCPTGARRGAHDFCADECLHLWLQGQGRYGEDLPPEARRQCGNYLMRTGLCLSACPKNRNLIPRTSFPFAAEDKPDSPPLIPLVLADEDTFRSLVPYHVYKYGIPYIRRNAIIALGNARDPAAIPVLLEGLQVLAPRCRAMCAWALSEIDLSAVRLQLMEAQRKETDPLVLEELNRILTQDPT